MKKKIIFFLVLVNFNSCTDKTENDLNVIELKGNNVLINNWKLPENPTLASIQTKFNVRKISDPNTKEPRFIMENGLEILLDEEKYFINGFKINYDQNKKMNLYFGSFKIEYLEISRFTNPEEIKQYFNCRGIFCGMKFNKIYVSFITNLDKSKINSIQIRL